MRVAIRTDASIQIGTGHLMRCLTLADALSEQGAGVHVLCREREGFDPQAVTSRGHTLHVLPAVEQLDFEPTSDPPHAAWLGCSQQQDAADCEAVLQTIGPLDWLVVDHYALDARWEQRMRPYTRNVFAIDDLADRPHACDMLLDQNLLPQMRSRYLGLVPDHCLLLLGPTYALLRPEFARKRDNLPQRDGHVRRIFVFFGGGDPDNMTGKAVEALAQLNRPDIAVDVVIGSAHPFKQKLYARAKTLPQVACHEHVTNMAALMARADVALGAGGTTTWERCCLGLPSIVAVLADNQTAIAQGIENAGAGWNLGIAQDLQPDDLLAKLHECLADPQMLRDASWRCLQLGDGLGRERLAKLMQIGAIQLREAIEEDCRLLWDWVNDPTVRASALNTQPIAWEEHQRWFRQKLSATDTLLFIAESEQGQPLGQIRFDVQDATAHIDYSVQREMRGLGLGKVILEKGLREARTRFGHPVIFQGEVKDENLASQHVFTRAGFARSAPDGGRSGASPHTHTDFSVAVVSDRASWLNGFIPKLIAELLDRGLSVRWVHTPADLLEETVVFYLGCGQLVPGEVLARHRHNLIVHESDLPKGRGWSPLTWQILEGRNEIPITLFEARESVDSGPIYLQKTMSFAGHELVEELRAKQGALTVQLCLEFVDRYPEPVQAAHEQEGKPTFYPKRGPQDSELDPDKTIREQFNLLRVVDNERYPAWFELEGQRYLLKIEKKKY